MTYTPTLEEFLTQHQPDEDAEQVPAEVFRTGGALDSIARSMEALVSLVQRLDAEASDVTALREHYGQLVEEADAKQALIDRVLEVCRPSTSKLANSIRAVLEPEPVEPEPVEQEPVADDPDSAGLIEPHPEAPVEEWREYARGCGYQGPDVDKANRSQIRTMLGLSHPATGESR